jgi:hypothetical protein
MPYDQLHPEDRAAVVINVARRLGLTDEDILTVADDAIDSDDSVWPSPADRLPAARHITRIVVNSAYRGDDDYDDLRHELRHTLGECTDSDPDCFWRDDDDDD